MILATRFGGFAAVDAMTWGDYNAARQLIAEERVGTRARASAALEDAAFSAARQALTR